MAPEKSHWADKKLLKPCLTKTIKNGQDTNSNLNISRSNGTKMVLIQFGSVAFDLAHFNLHFRLLKSF